MPGSMPEPLYLKLANQLEEMIRLGLYRPGDRIPSVRQASKQHQVSVPTVLQAYTLLEDRRVIEARPKSGYYVRSRQSLPLPATARGVPQARSLADYPPLMALVTDVVNPDFVRLGGAHPSAELLPGKKLARLMGSIARLNPGASITCDPAPGCPQLRSELSRRSLDWGRYLAPDEFIITHGATEALHLALRTVAQPGETVIIESPTHPGIINLLSQLKLRAVAIPSSPRDGLDVEATRKVAAREKVAAIVVIPNFNNPLGSCMPESNRRELMTLAEEYGIPVIEDDVYGDLQFEGERPHSLKALDHTGNSILCGSFSKTLAPGYRVGYLAAGRYHDAVLRLKTALNFYNAPLPALTIAEFLRNGGYEYHLRTLRNTFRQQVAKMRAALAGALPEGCKVSDPAGGFVLWVELPKTVDALQLFHEARNLKISIAPGHLFSPGAEFRHYMRINCGYPWSPRIEQAVATVAELVARRR